MLQAPDVLDICYNLWWCYRPMMCYIFVIVVLYVKYLLWWCYRPQMCWIFVMEILQSLDMLDICYGDATGPWCVRYLLQWCYRPQMCWIFVIDILQSFDVFHVCYDIMMTIQAQGVALFSVSRCRSWCRRQQMLMLWSRPCPQWHPHRVEPLPGSGHFWTVTGVMVGWTYTTTLHDTCSWLLNTSLKFSTSVTSPLLVTS